MDYIIAAFIYTTPLQQPHPDKAPKVWNNFNYLRMPRLMLDFISRVPLEDATALGGKFRGGGDFVGKISL